ncbi:MAG: hybrid sensor histidine kinase/response regulator [Verrucomicrobia bacterium]|nr:hybrid sensor histidine kinase/response regulator [Verrucomicrobiota bacterium]
MSTKAPTFEDSGRVLIVDDHPTNIDVLYDFLTDKGFEVLVAEDGKSALSRLQYAQPDIILLDIMMPGLDGFETCRQLKENPETAGIPVIYMTALDHLEDKMKGFESGAVDYITKPFQNQEVLARIRTHLALKRMEEDLQKNNEQLRDQNEALDAYARTVAHDLKNPLHLILNYARLIEEEASLPSVSQQDLHNIIQSAERMNHIIHDLLLLSQLRREQIRPVHVNMTSVVHDSLETLSTDLHAADTKLIKPSDFPDAMGLSAWIQAVWVNYISNAIKYGGKPGRIELICQKDPLNETHNWYGVKDNGQGIDPELRLTIFEEFSRAGGEKVEGHGIGLSICRRIIHRLGGRVGVQNNTDGPGCTFFFTLPNLPKKDDPS